MNGIHVPYEVEKSTVAAGAVPAEECERESKIEEEKKIANK